MQSFKKKLFLLSSASTLLTKATFAVPVVTPTGFVAFEENVELLVVFTNPCIVAFC